MAELAKDIQIAMLTTVDADGHLVSRPMALQETEFDGDFWFFAERTSPPGGRLATVISLAKAKVTGKPYDGGENEQVSL